MTLLAAGQTILRTQTGFEQGRIPATFGAAMKRVHEKPGQEVSHEKFRKIFREGIEAKTVNVLSSSGTRMRGLYPGTADRTLRRDRRDGIPSVMKIRNTDLTDMNSDTRPTVTIIRS